MSDMVGNPKDRFSHIPVRIMLNVYRELETLCYSVDELAPDLIDKVKYVLHGDFSHIHGMKTHAEEWANKVKYMVK